MVDLTIAISTARPPINFLLPTLNEIQSAVVDKTFEVLVYGPSWTHISHPLQPQYFTETFQHGNIYGYNLLASHAKGRHVAFLTDDMIVPKNFFDIVDFMDESKIRYGFHGFGMHDGQDYSPFPDRLILPNFGWIPGSEAVVDRVMQKFGTEYASERIPLIRFIAARKSTLDEVGYLFHPSFRNGGGDQWLSIWAWYNGQRLYEELPAKLEQRGVATSMLSNLQMDGETLRDLVYKLSIGYEKYV